MNNRILYYRLLVLFAIVFCISFVGCKKKEPKSPFKDKLPEYDSIVTTISNEEIEESLEDDNNITEEVKVLSIEVDGTSSGSPTPEQVQTALTNAGYYKGKIDGKIGPVSKESIVNFQRDNGLTVDGKVGPKTWTKLKDYLNPQNQNTD